MRKLAWLVTFTLTVNCFGIGWDTNIWTDTGGPYYLPTNQYVSVTNLVQIYDEIKVTVSTTNDTIPEVTTEDFTPGLWQDVLSSPLVYKIIGPIGSSSTNSYEVIYTNIISYAVTNFYNPTGQFGTATNWGNYDVDGVRVTVSNMVTTFKALTNNPTSTFTIPEQVAWYDSVQALRERSDIVEPISDFNWANNLALNADEIVPVDIFGSGDAVKFYTLGIIDEFVDITHTNASGDLTNFVYWATNTLTAAAGLPTNYFAYTPSTDKMGRYATSNAVETTWIFNTNLYSGGAVTNTLTPAWGDFDTNAYTVIYTTPTNLTTEKNGTTIGTYTKTPATSTVWSINYTMHSGTTTRDYSLSKMDDIFNLLVCTDAKPINDNAELPKYEFKNYYQGRLDAGHGDVCADFNMDDWVALWSVTNLSHTYDADTNVFASSGTFYDNYSDTRAAIDEASSDQSSPLEREVSDYRVVMPAGLTNSPVYRYETLVKTFEINPTHATTNIVYDTNGTAYVSNQWQSIDGQIDPGDTASWWFYSGTITTNDYPAWQYQSSTPVAPEDCSNEGAGGFRHTMQNLFWLNVTNGFNYW